MPDTTPRMADAVDVLIVSPLATVRAGLAALLAAADGLQVVGEAVSLERVTASLLTPEVGVVLLLRVRRRLAGTIARLSIEDEDVLPALDRADGM